MNTFNKQELFLIYNAIRVRMNDMQNDHRNLALLENSDMKDATIRSLFAEKAKLDSLLKKVEEILLSIRKGE